MIDKIIVENIISNLNLVENLNIDNERDLVQDIIVEKALILYIENLNLKIFWYFVTNNNFILKVI